MSSVQDRDRVVSVRLTEDQHDKLVKLAKSRGQTMSQVLREAVLGEVATPIGWHCEHVSVHGPFSRVTANCGCEMKPAYEVRQLPEWERRMITQAHKDGVVIGSGVPVAPWRPRSPEPASDTERKATP